MRKSKLTYGKMALSCIAIGWALASGAAQAQSADAADSAEDDRSRLGDIVVTARKVAENLQSVPVAVTVQTGESLTRQNALTFPDVARLTPGLTIKISSASPYAVNISMRGQYQSDILATLDPSVATYVDGYYWARAYGLTADLLDVRSAQVLRGPQGTLFGRNTTGGAFLVETNDPSTNGVSGSLSATYGRFNERSATGVLNLPLGEKIAIRAAGNYIKRDGFFNNTLKGTKLGEIDRYTARVKVLFQPTDTFSVLLSGEQFESHALSRPYGLRFLPPSSLANLEAAFEAFGPGAPATRSPQGFALLNAYIARTAGTDNVELNSDPASDAKTRTLTGTASLETPFGMIKFIGGYRDVTAFILNDLEGSPYALLESPGTQDLKQYSGELQITGKAFADQVDFAVGSFAFHEEGFDASRAVAVPAVATAGGAPLTASRIYGVVDTDSIGVYGQATAHLSDAFSVTGGLRYSAEDKGITSFNRTVKASDNSLLFCNITGADPVTCAITRKDSYKGLSYTFGLNYQVNPDTLVYVKTGKGFRSGGQNLRASGSAGAAFVPFKPEVVKEQEIGLKTELFDRRVRFNLAAFYNETSDLQRSTIVASTNVLGQPTTATIVGNAGKARTYGGEAELTAVLADGFTLTGTAALVQPKYKKYIDPYTGYDRSSERFEQVPKWSFSVAANYERPVGSGFLKLHADYAWQDKTALNAFDFFTDASGVIRDVTNGSSIGSLAIAQATKDALTQPAGGSANARAALSFMDDSLEIAVFGRNVFNRRIYNQGLYLPAPFSTISGQRNDPVTYGATVTFRFAQ